MTHTHRQPYSRIRMRLKRIINVIRWGKKVWFTEFARPTTRDPAMELEYMQVVIGIVTIIIAMMDATIIIIL